jgi:predicted kinase
MEAIIFIGIQGSGKSTFYKQELFNSHLRISMDLLNTRNKEQKLLEYAVGVQQRLVIDNTNPKQFDRARYIPLLKSKKYKVIAYFFPPDLERALAWNAQRTGKQKIPEKGVMATFSNLEPPVLAEGFDEIYEIHINESGIFEKQLTSSP